MDSLSNSMYINRGVILEDSFVTQESSSFAKNQLNHLSDDEVFVDDKAVAVWGKAKTDLSRMGQFRMQINGKERVVYQKGKTALEGQDISDELVVKSILDASGNQLHETAQYAKLLEQKTGLLAGNEVMLKHRRTDTHVFGAFEKATLLSVDKESFSVTYEMLGRVRNLDDIEDESQQTYIKVKTVIEGRREDLCKDTSRIRTKVMHTKEVGTERQARSLSYGGMFDFSSDAKSLIR